MRRLAFAPLFLAACAPPAPPSPPPANPQTEHVRPEAPKAPPASACPEAPHDPDGWFALGDPALPDPSPAAEARSVTLGFDEAGQPFAAVVRPDGKLAAVTLQGNKPRIDPLGPVDPFLIAAGAAAAKGPVVAVVQQDHKTVVFSRETGEWRRREVGSFCSSDSWSVEFGAGKDMPSLAIDGAGGVWEACVQRTFAPVHMMPSSPAVLASRIRLGRLNGTRWVEADVELRKGSDSMGTLTLSTRANGELVASVPVSLGSPAVLEVTVPMLTKSGSTQYGNPRSGPASSTQRGQPRVAHGCAGEEPCSLEGDVRLELPINPHALARRGDAWFAAVVAPLRIAALEGSKWRLLLGDAPPGVSATPNASSAPALSIDACGRPVVLWREEGSKIMGRAWNGREFRPLPVIAAPGPHGLVVGQNGDIFVGSWTAGERAFLDVRRVRADATVESLPPLKLDTNEWRTIDMHRARLSEDGVLHAAFPIHDNVFAAAHRIGFVFREGAWRPEEVPPSLLEAKVMPWGADVNAAQQSALAIDEGGRRILVWAHQRELRVASWEAGEWRALPGLSAGDVVGVPAIFARAGRLCVAWAGPSGLSTEIFVRCHTWGRE